MNRTRAELTVDRANTFAARDLDDEMDAGRWSNVEVAAHLGCSEKVLRNLRTGEAVLTLGRIYRLPPKLRDGVLRRAAARFPSAVPLGAATPEAQTNVCLGRAGALIVRASEALRDGRIDEAEARAMLAEAHRSRAALDALERTLARFLEAGSDARGERVA